MYKTLLFASIGIIALKGSITAVPTYEFEMGKGSTITAVQDKARTVFIVTNSFGIGQGTIKLKSGRWPETVCLRFQYKNGKGGGFKNLEHISLASDRIYAQGSRSQSGHFPFYFLDRTVPKQGETIDSSKAAGILKILVKQHNGALEITLPTTMMAGSSQLKAYWIDWYRN